jgi:hypothetical protein
LIEDEADLQRYTSKKRVRNRLFRMNGWYSDTNREAQTIYAHLFNWYKTNIYWFYLRERQKRNRSMP